MCVYIIKPKHVPYVFAKMSANVLKWKREPWIIRKDTNNWVEAPVVGAAVQDVDS